MSEPQFDSRDILHQLDHQATQVRRQIDNLSFQINQKVQANDRAGAIALAKQYKALQDQLKRIQNQTSMCNGMNSMLENAQINKKLVETQKILTEQLKKINSMLDPAELRRVNDEWEKEMRISEMIESEMDSVLTGLYPNLEEEEDEEVNKVLMEVAGIQLKGMSLVPAGQPKVQQEEVDAEKWLREYEEENRVSLEEDKLLFEEAGRMMFDLSLAPAGRPKWLQVMD